MYSNATMNNLILGYVASSTSLLAFGSQFMHTIRTKTTDGLSIQRTIFDSLSLALWVAYATRVEDIPLLIAVALELAASLGLIGAIVWNKREIYFFKKEVTPPSTPQQRLSEEHILVEVDLPRRNSV